MGFQLQYKGDVPRHMADRGWWIGAQDSDMSESQVEKFVAGCNANSNVACRAIDNETGRVIGEACSVCGGGHPGHDGGCLL